jgi:hypothetical protein
MKTLQKADLSDDLRKFTAEIVQKALVSLSVCDLADLHVALAAVAAAGAVEVGMPRALFLEQVTAFYDEYVRHIATEDTRQLVLLH